MSSCAKPTARSVKRKLGAFIKDSITRQVLDSGDTTRQSFTFVLDHGVRLVLAVSRNAIDARNPIAHPLAHVLPEFKDKTVPGKLILLKIVNVIVDPRIQKKGIFTYVVSKLREIADKNTKVAGLAVMQIQNKALEKHLKRKGWAYTPRGYGPPCMFSVSDKEVAKVLSTQSSAIV